MKKTTLTIVLISAVIVCCIVALAIANTDKGRTTLADSKTSVEADVTEEAASKPTDILDSAMNSIKDQTTETDEINFEENTPLSGTEEFEFEKTLPADDIRDVQVNPDSANSELVLPDGETEIAADADAVAGFGDDIVFGTSGKKTSSGSSLSEDKQNTDKDLEYSTDDTSSKTVVEEITAESESEEETTEKPLDELWKTVDSNPRKNIKSYEQFMDLPADKKKEIINSFDTPGDYNDWLAELIAERNKKYDEGVNVSNDNLDQATGN